MNADTVQKNIHQIISDVKKITRKSKTELDKEYNKALYDVIEMLSEKREKVIKYSKFLKDQGVI